MTTRHTLPLSLIRTDGGTQMRAGLNPQTVEEYSTAMLDGWGTFPPVVTYYDGADYWLADGFHRIAACRQAPVDPDGPIPSVPAIIHAGTQRDAILHAASANAQHGLRRSDADKRRSVQTLLADPEWGAWSDREIARRCLVSPTFVATVRSLVTVHVDSDQAAQRTYRTKTGATATMHTANIGKSPAHNNNSDGETSSAGAASPARCRRCKRPLTDAASIAAGIGPCCRNRGNHAGDDTGDESEESDAQELDAQTPLLLPVSLRADYESDEWYTPTDVIEAARRALGSIDLDPASCALAQTVVRAERYYTRQQDGLAQTWLSHTLWLNPPYSEPAPWIFRLLDQYQNQNIAAAVVLVNNATETGWFQSLLRSSAIFCLPERRLAFWRADHNNVGARQGQTIFYFGDHINRFANAFARFGRSYISYDL